MTRQPGASSTPIRVPNLGLTIVTPPPQPVMYFDSSDGMPAPPPGPHR